MAREDDIHSHVGERHVIGLSQIVGVTVLPGQVSTLFKYFSGGSLEIGGASLTWGSGYLMAVGEALSIDNAATFYLAATGATTIAYSLRGRSAGLNELG